MARVVQGYLAVAPLDDGDRHAAVRHCLRGEIGLGDEIAVVIVVAGNAGRHATQVGEVEHRAGFETGSREQLAFGEKPSDP